MKNYCEIFAALPVIAMALTISSCREEPDPEVVTPGESESLIFTIGGIQSNDTKSASITCKAVQTDRIALSEPGDPDQIYLIETVEDMDDTYYNVSDDTKGTPVYTETFSGKYHNFSTVPYAAGATSAYAPVKSYYSGQIDGNRYAFDFDGGWPMATDGKTPAVNSFMFFMAAPADLTSTSAQYGCSNIEMAPTDGTIEFDYASPAAATDQIDLLFTSKNVSYANYRKGSKILFYHTLAGVKFKSGNAMREGTNEAKTKALMTDITSIKLTNILSNGHCTVTPDQSYDADDSNASASVPKSSAAVEWTWNEGTAHEIEKSYADYSISVNDLANNTTQFPESTAFEGGNELGQLNLNSSNFDKTFMFVPQTTSGDGEVVLIIEYTLRNITYKKAVNFGKRTWEAGKLYTYTLTANHVGVAIKDHVNNGDGGDGKTKTFDYIKNTGNVDEYIRVAVVGNWYDSHSTQKGQDQIVCPWGDTEEEGSWAVFAQKPWIKVGDYYYFPYRVEPGTTVDEILFETYKVKECPSSLYKTSAHLELDFIVQAIDASWIEDETKKEKMTEYGWAMDKLINDYYPAE